MLPALLANAVPNALTQRTERARGLHPYAGDEGVWRVAAWTFHVDPGCRAWKQGHADSLADPRRIRCSRVNSTFSIPCTMLTPPEPTELERVVDATAETLMKKATTGFVGGYEEGRHHTGQEPVEAGPTMGTMDELPSARAGFSLRVKPDRRRLVIPVDPAIDRRRTRHSGGT